MMRTMLSILRRDVMAERFATNHRHRHGRSLRRGLWILLPFVMAACATLAEEAQTLRLLGATDGLCRSLVWSGKQIVAGAGANLIVLDATDPTRIRRLGSVTTPGEVMDLVVQSDLAFLADGRAGLVVVDLADPVAPRVLSRVATVGSAYRLALDGTIAHVAIGGEGLRSYDVSDPRHPREVGAFAGVHCRDLAARDGKVYLASKYKGLLVLDATNPAHLIEQSRLDLDCAASLICLSGDLVCLSTYGLGLIIVDVSDSNLPRLLAKQEVGIVDAMAIADSIVYVKCGLGFRPFDIHDPEHPVKCDRLEMSGGVQDLTVQDGIAALSSGTKGLHFIDVSMPKQPVKLNTYSISGATVSVVATDDHAVLFRGDGGLDVLDVRDPTQPLVMAHLDMFRAKRMVVHDGLAGIVSYPEGMQLVDLRDPERPLKRGRLDLQGCHDMDIKDRIACLAADKSGLIVVDVGDADHPVELGRWVPPNQDDLPVRPHTTLEEQALAKWQEAQESQWGKPKTAQHVKIRHVAMMGNFALAGGDHTMLHVVSLEEPASPQLIGQVELPNKCGMIAVGDRIACLATGKHGLLVLDLSKPTDPRFVATWPWPQAVYCVAMQDGRAYAADEVGGLFVLDLADPGHPKLVMKTTATSIPSSVAVDGARIYVSGAHSGLQIFEME